METTLKSFKKDKVPGPDGFPVEFFLAFFDLLGEEVVNLVEDARLARRVLPLLNSTFITLILKIYKPTTFVDFHPISLYNLIYKLIAKVVALHLKPFLDLSISPQQFGFLKNRQIIEPISITQEALHSVRSRNKSALINWHATGRR